MGEMAKEVAWAMKCNKYDLKAKKGDQTKGRFRRAHPDLQTQAKDRKTEGPQAPPTEWTQNSEAWSARRADFTRRTQQQCLMKCPTVFKDRAVSAAGEIRPLPFVIARHLQTRYS